MANSTARSLSLLGRNHFLNQADPKRFLRVKHVSGEQVAHGISPTDAIAPARGATSEREQAASNLRLPDESALGRDDHVAAQRQLDSAREAHAMNRCDERLG